MSNLAKLFALQIIAGNIGLDDVPDKLKAEVEELKKETEKAVEQNA